MRRLMLFMAVLCVAATASGQTLTNPSRAEFTASTDHAVIDSYVLGYFVGGATSPIMEVSLAKPTPGADALITATIDARPLGFGSYVAKVRAVAGTMTSEWSEPSNGFSRTPFPPALPVLRK